MIPDDVRSLLEGTNFAHLCNALSERYTGKPFPIRTGTVYLIEPETTGTMSLPFQP